MAFSIIKLRGDTKINWSTANPILRSREWGVEWETAVGVGEVKVKIGDGVTNWNNLDYAIVNNVTKKIVASFAEVTADNPELTEGSAMDLLWAVTKKKFEYLNTQVNEIKTLIGAFSNITIESAGIDEAVADITSAVKKLNTGKLSTADIYNGLDSTNPNMALSAVQGKALDGRLTSLKSDLSTETTERKAEIAVERERINQFTRLGEGSTTGDAELQDARVDKDGKTHANVGEHIRSVSSELKNDLVDFKKFVDGRIEKPDFEIGDIYVNGSGQKEYYNSTERVRIKKDTKIHLEKDTIVGLNDYSDKRIIVYKEKSDGTYATLGGWVQKDISIAEDGDYLILMSYNPQKIINSVDEFTSELFIKKNSYIDKINATALTSLDNANTAIYNSESNRDDISIIFGNIDNRVLCEFELGDRYINSDGVLTYYDSTTRIRTKKDTYIDLKKGNVVGLRTYDKYRLLIHKYNENDNTWVGVGDWSNKDVRIENDGKYAILLQKDTPETVTNIEDYTSKLYIKKYGVLPTITNIEAKNEIFTDEVIATVNSVRAKTTSRALMFGVITDTHYDGKRKSYYEQSMENLERVSRQLGLDAIVHLGDIINGYESKDIAKEQLQACIEKLVKCGARNTFVLIGNHDNNNGAGDSNRLTDAELYSITQRHNESYVNRNAINLASNSIYNAISDNYYVDYPTFKIRLIMFNSCYYSQGFSDETIAWVRTTITSSPTDYKFVFMTHESTEKELNGGNALGNATTFKNLLAQYKDRILCYIHGHSHCDYVGYDNEFAQISICCSVPDQPVSDLPSGATQPTRTIGTVTQDCFDIVIILPDENKVECVRFGAGNDRTIPFRSN